jgi:hypothetical protein
MMHITHRQLTIIFALGLTMTFPGCVSTPVTHQYSTVYYTGDNNQRVKYSEQKWYYAPIEKNRLARAALQDLLISNGLQSSIDEMSHDQIDLLVNNLMVNMKVTKLPENIARTAEVHERLLLTPLTDRKQDWILKQQIRDEITNEEKTLILATFQGGSYTLNDWFQDLHDVIPPVRPEHTDAARAELFLAPNLKRAVLEAWAKQNGINME